MRYRSTRRGIDPARDRPIATRTADAPIGTAAKTGRTRRGAMRPALRGGPHRSGVLLLEALVALGMLAVAIVVGAKVLGALSAQRRTMAEYQLAALEAANVLERVSVFPWESLDGSVAEQVQLSEGARKVLSDARLEVQVSPVESDPAAKRIVVRVRWAARAAQPDRIVRLVAWRYRQPARTAKGKREETETKKTETEKEESPESS